MVDPFNNYMDDLIYKFISKPQNLLYFHQFNQCFLILHLPNHLLNTRKNHQKNIYNSKKYFPH